MMTTPSNLFTVRFRSFWKRPSVLLGLFFALWTLPAGASFFQPEYERLEGDVLKTRFDKRGEKVTPSDLESALFYLEYLELSLSLHRAQAVASWLYEQCQSSVAEEDPGNARVCAIVLAQSVESASAWDKSSLLRRTIDLMKRGQAGDPKEKMYAEARVYLSLPAIPGIRPTQGLVALQFLNKMSPDSSSTKYFLAKGYERIGNRHAYEEWRKKAIEAKDRRAQLDFERPLRLERAKNDGLSYGFAPRLFFSPNGGLGGQASYHDDRLFDEDRAFSIGGFATTRSQWGIDFRARDFEMVAPAGIIAEIKIFSGEQDTFDLGPHSDLNRRFTPSIQRQEARLGFQQAFQRIFALELGWIWFHQSASNSVRLATLPDASSAYFTGPYFEVGLDTRDSEYLPRSGGYLKAFGHFPTDGLLSPRSLERWKFSGGYFLPGFFRQHVFSVQSALQWVGGADAPWAAYPRLGAPLKGIREGRFSDRALVAGTASYAFPVALGFGLDIFGNAAAVNQTVRGAIGGAYQLGGGAGLTWNSDSSRAAFWQISLGRFGGETVVVAAGSLGL